jgi:hypothetical protein
MKRLLTIMGMKPSREMKTAMMTAKNQLHRVLL